MSGNRQGISHCLESGHPVLSIEKTRMMGLPHAEKKFDDMLSRFIIYYKSVTDGRTGRRRDRNARCANAR